MVKNGKALEIMGLLNQVYPTNDLMNWADWLNDFCVPIVIVIFGLTSSLLCNFEIYFVLVSSIWFTVKPNNLRKFYFQISEKHDWTSIFAEGTL